MFWRYSKHRYSMVDKRFFSRQYLKKFQESTLNKIQMYHTWSEVFIERQNNLNAEDTICFDQKLHDVITFLICISPTGFLTFLSDAYNISTSCKTFQCSDTIFQITWILLINCDHKVIEQQLRSTENKNSTKC